MQIMMMAAFCAFFVKGLCGFADALVFTTILGFVADNVNISPLSLLLALPGNLMLAWRGRRELDWRVWLPVTVMVAVGCIPGTFLLKNGDAGIIKRIFGVVVVLIGLEMLFGELVHRKSTKGGAGLLAIGILSGLLSGMYGVGALLAAYMNRMTDSSRSFKANICAVFLAENLIRLALYSCTGIITLGVCRQAAVLLPFMLCGILVGIKSGERLNEQVVRKLVVVLLIISGAVLVVNR